MSNPCWCTRRADLLERAPSHRLLVLEAAFFLAAMFLLTRLVAFNRLRPHLGTAFPAGHNPPFLDRHDAVSVAVGKAIHRAAELLPFALVCLPRALAGWCMLRRRGVACQLHFGRLPRPQSAGKATNPPLLHSWLTAGATEVAGFPAAHAAVEMGFFAAGHGG